MVGNREQTVKKIAPELTPANIAAVMDVLTNGSLPLAIFDDVIDEWIASQQ